MAIPVYSTLFIAAAGIADGAGYVVPAGMVAIVRDIDTLCFGSPADTAFALTDEATSTYVAYHLYTGLNEFWSWRGRQVIPGGAEMLASQSGPQDIAVRVSGYLLSGAPT